MRYLGVLAGLAAFSTIACAGPTLTADEVAQCKAGPFCTITGLVTVQRAEGIWMGRLELPDSRCVSVSLPEEQVVKLRGAAPQRMTVRGRVYGEPTSHDVVDLKIEGRDIGLGLCGDFLVFVDD